MSGGFDSLGLMPELIRATDELSWILPTDVQDEAIPLILGGGDVMVASETGSGKTAAFCLPAIQIVHERLRNNGSNKKMKVEVNASESEQITLNDLDKDIFLNLSQDLLECSSSADKLWVGIKATHGIKSGKYGYECKVKGNGICRLGWSTIGSALELGKDSNGFGYGGTAMKSNNNNFQAYGEKFGNGDIITALLDWNEKTISYMKNGNYLGKAFGISESIHGTVLYPAIALKGVSATVKFGEMDFAYQLPPGFLKLCQAESHDIISNVKILEYKVDSYRSPSAVILLPSRDLAEQVYQCLNDLCKYVTNPEIKSVLLVGGDNFKTQKQIISAGIDIIVGTTGKVVDLVKSKTLDFSKIKMFILDEADRMIETDNLNDIMLLYQACSKSGSGDDRLQVCFFSATLHDPKITNLSESICFNPIWVDLKGKDSIPESVHHVIYRIDATKDNIAEKKIESITDGIHTNNEKNPDDINSLLVKQIKMQILPKVIDRFNMSQVMIFCRTNLDCDNLEQFFNKLSGTDSKKFISKIDTGKENKYSCCVLAGMRSMAQRRESLEAFKDGYVRILICTDVAARGIDISGLPYVINLTLPDVPENYIHRIGRVGRGDCIGLAISLVSMHREKVWYHGIHCKSKQNKSFICNNKKLLEERGCTIWYDEQKYLNDIEARISMKIPELDSEFNLPEELLNKNVRYGESNKGNSISNNSEDFKKRYGIIESTVHELNQLEIIAQNSYLSLYNSYY